MGHMIKMSHSNQFSTDGLNTGVSILLNCAVAEVREDESNFLKNKEQHDPRALFVHSEAMFLVYLDQTQIYRASVSADQPEQLTVVVLNGWVSFRKSQECWFQTRACPKVITVCKTHIMQVNVSFCWLVSQHLYFYNPVSWLCPSTPLAELG